MDRRHFLGVTSSLLPGVWSDAAAGATPDSTLLEQKDLKLDGDRGLARRALLLVPRHGRPIRSLLVLLHGLGETGNELLGIHAWGERYGLVSAYERLAKPPVAPLSPKLGYLEPERTSTLNASLAKSPFGRIAMVCPVTVNPHRAASPQRILDRYADWIQATLLPAAYEQLGAGKLHVGLDGCSLGGYVGLEVFLRKPELFSTFGMVQGAIGRARAKNYAEQMAKAIARVGPRPIHLETSSRDPYREPTRALSDALLERGVPNVFRLSPGPHDQPWLREVGTLEMLYWHEQQLSGKA